MTDVPPVTPAPASPRAGVRALRAAVVGLVLLPCLWACVTTGPLGRAIHTWYLRGFADHAAIRASCMDLLRAHPGGTVHLKDAAVPPALRRLGSRCSARVEVDHVVVDVGSFWVDSYGFVAAQEGAGGGWIVEDQLLIPGLYWWDAG